LIGWIIIIVLVVVGISYGWGTIEQIGIGINEVKQVIESNDFKEGSELGQELTDKSLGFLEERLENYQANNP